MKIGIVGCGSIAKRHIRNLSLIDNQIKLLAFDIDRSRLEEMQSNFGVSTFSDFTTLLEERPKAVLICSPNSTHLHYALLAAEAGCHLFVEKPLSHNLDGVGDLISVIDKRNLSFLLGCNWKFHPSFRLMKEIIDNGSIGKIWSFTVIAGQYLPDWHPWEDYRLGYSANKALGGGVLLDSHEFCYLQWFLGPIKKVFCRAGTYSHLEIDTEDIAELVVELADRTVGSIHIDYLQHPYRRLYYFYGEKGAMEWDYRQKQVSLYLRDKKKWEVFKEAPDYDVNATYIAELQHFLNVLEGKEESLTGIDEAKQMLTVVESAKRSADREELITL